MKTLPAGNGQGAWDNRLVRDMAYIKKHLRYPVTGKTLMPVLVWGALLLLAVSLVTVSIIWGGRDGRRFPFLLFSINIFTFAVIGIRYLQTLKFSQIRTDLFVQENISILESFLKAQQLLVFRHPELSEVFQILSRNLLYSSKEEKREVIIFIADDKRILINSHFTGSAFTISPGGRHHKQMAEKLKEWIKTHRPPGTGLVQQTF